MRGWKIYNPFNLIIILGFISLFADITYEGARSIAGFLFSELHTPAVAVGVVGGFGEFLSFALRIISGVLVDKTRRYWLITFMGYTLTFVSIPALAFAGRWELASFLLILERIGKAIRSPARDTIISFASHQKIGRGFAVHEFLDQIGAILGPIFVSVSLPFFGVKNVFLLLGIPAFFSFFFLFIGYRLFPNPEKIISYGSDSASKQNHPSVKKDTEFESKRVESKDEKSGSQGILRNSLSLYFQRYFIFIFLVFVLLQVSGFLHFQFISYHLSKSMSGSEIAILFAVAMAVDAVAGLIWGTLYDKFGGKILFAIPFFTFLSTFFFFKFPYVGAVIWGIVLGFYETVFKSSVSEYSGVEERGAVFGLFHAIFGLGWLFGSSAMGFLYPDISKIILFSLLCQVISLFLISFSHFLKKSGNITA